ncbi:MAG: septum formation initiator family protein, partial [Acetatifactor sp.]|nr:septum formation initiator family protein [Acetatifactor sp.]
MELSQRLDVYAEREAELNQQIEAEERRAEEIENFRKYTQTKRYVEEVAKEKLGLVYEGEILFKEED